jgi:hypothetical protein
MKLMPSLELELRFQRARSPVNLPVVRARCWMTRRVRTSGRWSRQTVTLCPAIVPLALSSRWLRTFEQLRRERRRWRHPWAAAPGRARNGVRLLS